MKSNRNMKRRIGLYMAFVMLFSVLVPFATPVMVHAVTDPGVINVNINDGLSVWGQNSTPQRGNLASATTAPGRENQHVYMNFVLDTNARYILRYVIPNVPDNIEVQLVIDVDSHGVATVRYIRPGDGDPGMQVWMAPLPGGVGNWIDIEDYVRRADRPNFSDYIVVAEHPGAALVPSMPRHPSLPAVVQWPPLPPGFWPPPAWDRNAFDPVDITTFPPEPPNWPPVEEWPPHPMLWSLVVEDPGSFVGYAINPVRPPQLPATVPWPNVPGWALGGWNPAAWFADPFDPANSPVHPPGWPAYDWEDFLINTGWVPLVTGDDLDPEGFEPQFPPEFIISQDRGFSFIYHGEFVHIRMDSDRNFHFAADHFAPGYIYDVVLQRVARVGPLPDAESPAPPVLSYNGTLVNTGLTGISVMPFANAIAEDGSLDRTNARLPAHFVDRTLDALDRNPPPGDPNYPDGRWPAMPEEPLGLRLTFEQPLFLPLSGGVGNPDPTDLSLPNRRPMVAYMDFVSYGNVNNFNLGIPDMVAPVPTITGGGAGIEVRPQGGAGGPDFLVGPLTPAGRRPLTVDFLIYDTSIIGAGEDVFHPGLLFLNTSYVTLGDIPPAAPGAPPLVGPPLRSRPAPIDIPNPAGGASFGAFTLLNFDITSINGLPHVRILSPYFQMGEFIVRETPRHYTPPGAAVTLSRTHLIRAGDPIPPIPLRADALDPNQRFVQVFFRPGYVFSDTQGTDNEINFVLDGSWPIRSQGLYYSGDPEDIVPRTPEHFTVDIPPNGHVPRSDDLERRSGHVDLVMTWQVGTQDLLRRFFQTANAGYNTGNYLDIYYEFRWTDNPYSIDPDHFVEVRARMQSRAAIGTTPGAITVRYYLVERDATGNIIRNIPAGGACTITGDDSIGGIRFSPTVDPDDYLIWSPTHHHLAQIQIQVDTYHFNHPNPPVPVPIVPPSAFSFPGIYFLNVRPVQVGNERGFDTPSSQYDGFTLSEFEDFEVPPPQSLRAYNARSYNTYLGDLEDRVSFDLTWYVHLGQVYDYFLMSYGLALEPDSGLELAMNIYISQNEELMRTVFPETNISGEQRVEDSTLIRRDRHLQRLDIVGNNIIDGSGLLSGVSETTPGGTPGGPIFFSPIRGNSYTGDREMREALRAYEVVGITDLRLWDGAINPGELLADWVGLEPHPVSFRFDGLDRNQQYYIYADIVITQILPTGVAAYTIMPLNVIISPGDITDIVDSSLLSNMVGITVPDDREVPDGIDRDPMAPVLNVDRESITLNAAIIYWDRVQQLPLTDRLIAGGYFVEYEYELIRIRDNQKSNDPEELIRLLNARVPFAQAWASLSGHQDIIGFQTVASTTPGAIELDDFGGQFGRPNPPNMDLIVPRQTVPPGLDPIQVHDQTMRSNTVYFYYARTVRTVWRMVDGVEELVTRNFSVWSNISVTTTIAGAPRNLRIMQDDAIPGIVANLMNEVIIEFEAPILYASLQELMADGGIILEYEIQVDDEGWNRRGIMRTPFLIQHAREGSDEPPGWTWFLYHVTGIQPGRMHHIRVRLVQVEDGVRVSESMWSNTATWLPPGDPEEDEYNRLERDWEDYLRRRLEELLRRPYWVIRSDSGAFQIIYRINMFNNVVMEATGGRIHLPFISAPQSTYYLPIMAFSQAWDAELSFILTNPEGNMQIMVPARSIDLHNNDVVIDVGAAIRRREFEDYMVRFNVDWSNPPSIQGDETLTYVANIRFDLVSTRTEILPWERRLTRDLENRIEEIVSDPATAAFIRNAVRDENTTNEDISREMVYIVETVATYALARLVRESKRDYLMPRHQAWQVPRLDRSIAVAVRHDPAMAGPGLAIQGFQSPGGNLWNNVPTMDVLDSQGFFTMLPGIFVFTGRMVVIQGIEQVTGGPVATGVVARHGLDDFFGRDDMSIHQLATRSQLINSVARMMGAPRGTDAVPWLRANGVNVAAAGMNNPITYQSALHLIMMVYEAQTGTSVDSLRITNFTVVNNLSGLDQHYRASVAAAIELGLVNGNNLQPGAQLTVGSLLEVLAVLDRLVGL